MCSSQYTLQISEDNGSLGPNNVNEELMRGGEQRFRVIVMMEWSRPTALVYENVATSKNVPIT